MSKYTIHKPKDLNPPLILKTKHKLVWDKGVVYGITKPKEILIKMSKLHISSRGTAKIDKDGNITDFKLRGYEIVRVPKVTLFRHILNFFKRLWNFIKLKQR